MERSCVDALEELLLRRADQVKCPFPDDVRDWTLCRYAAVRGDVQVLQWMFENGHTWSYYTWASVSRIAAKHGWVHVLQWLRSAGRNWRRINSFFGRARVWKSLNSRSGGCSRGREGV